MGTAAASEEVFLLRNERKFSAALRQVAKVGETKTGAVSFRFVVVVAKNCHLATSSIVVKKVSPTSTELLQKLFMPRARRQQITETSPLDVMLDVGVSIHRKREVEKSKQPIAKINKLSARGGGPGARVLQWRASKLSPVTSTAQTDPDWR